MKRYVITFILLVLAIIYHSHVSTALSISDQWKLITGSEAQAFSEFQYYYASLPRLVLAIVIGATLGLIGSVLQQMMQNRLADPMTLGMASGAWLALVCASIWMPALLVDHSAWVAMIGALMATILVLLIAGRHGIGGLPIILAGMAVHILFGSFASAAILLNEQYTQNLFIWGAGDLTQTDWQWVEWLLPKLSIIFIVLLIAHRPLMLLRLGEQGATARGLNLWPIFTLLFMLVLWLLGHAITAVGVIGFIGLLAPNIARALATRSAMDELLYSLLLGALLLVITDTLAVLAGEWSQNVIASGVSAALIGAPCLIWFALKRFGAQDHANLQLPGGAQRLHASTVAMLGVVTLVTISIAIMLAPSHIDGGYRWLFQWPEAYILDLRWPPLLAAATAGAGVAIAGTILQRLIRNPLASPDILGLTAGATLALILGTYVLGTSIHNLGPAIAFVGSLAVLGLIILLGQRSSFAPGIIILVGISLAAFVDGIIQFILSKGGEEVYSIITWLTGSSYHVNKDEAIMMALGISLLATVALFASRWLTLISAGDGMAIARGLNAHYARLGLLALVALLSAMVTALLGPVAFVGLLAPHMAALLGAKKASQQLMLAPLIGALLMLIADWSGRTLIYPAQIPAGVVASILGGSYFIYLLARRQKSIT